MKEIKLNNLIDNSKTGVLRITRFKYIPSSIYRRSDENGYTYFCTNVPYVSLLYKYKDNIYYGSIIHNGKEIYSLETTDDKYILHGLLTYLESYNYNISISILNPHTIIAQKYNIDNHKKDKIEYFTF